METTAQTASQANWLILDEALKPEWEREASKAVSKICGRKISVTIELPTEAESKAAYETNKNLCGVIRWFDEEGHKHGVEEILPFHGVFILNNPGDRYAQAAVWNSYLEPLPKKMPQEGKDKIRDDLAQRLLRTFPRQLLERLCGKMTVAEKDRKLFDEFWWSRECLVPVTAWLNSPASLVRRSRPNNASDLMAQICGVRRYVVSRDKAMGYAPAKRMNHPSFDGRLCPVDTPESEMVGISLQLARGAWVDKDGFVHPAEGPAVVDKVSWGTSLIPFSHNNDGARDMMGAKNLRQATPVKGREIPAVKTGTEESLAEAMAPLMEVGICPESRNGDKSCIAMGCDLLVAYMPWNGWNVDDAVVISESVVSRMAVVERKAFSRPVESHWQIKDFKPKDRISRGDVIARFAKPSGREFVIRYNDDADAKVAFIKYGDGTSRVAPGGAAMEMFSYEIEKEIPLGPGDKLMARHGNKGVVGRIVPEAEMPRLPNDERLPEGMRGKAIEILVNPHGVLSRMNPGQLLETHLGWLFRAGGYGEDDVRAEGKTGAIGAPEVGMLDYGKVQALLEKTGLDRNGKIKLVLPSGGKTLNPVVVGYEHFVRLHHIPELKAQARGKGDGAAYNSVTQQPAHGRKFGGGQRLGEMEVWALCAHGADHVLEEMLGAKSDKDWSGEWTASGDMPSGKEDDGTDKYGFAHLLRDWLRALCIGIEKKDGLVQFKFLDDGEALKKEIGGEGKRVISDKASGEVRSGHFACSAKNNSCKWCLPGSYPLSGDKRQSRLKFGAFLQTLGYDFAGPLEDADDGQFTVKLFRGRESVGKLSVEPVDYKKDSATTLNLVVAPIPGKEPVGWPPDEAFKKICLRAEVQVSGMAIKDYRLANPKNRRQISLPASILLGELKRRDSKYSVCKDFSLVCPSHRTEYLKIGPPYDIVTTSVQGGLFDPDIFSGKDDWGYIELPVEVNYPSVEGVNISIIPVLPLHYRKQRDAAALSIDRSDISHYYQEIVRLCQEYGKSKSGKKKERSPNNIQKAVADLFAELSRRMEKKHGFLRHDGLGRRVNRSFRLVITPNPELRWDQAGVPADVLWEMFGDRVLQEEAAVVQDDKDGKLPVERNAGWTWKSRLIPADAYKRVRGFLEKHRDLVVLLNRQPTLRRDSMQAFHPVPLPPESGEVLQLSPLCCEGFAADFDGDEMAGHFPVTEAAQEDSRKLLPSRNVRSVATGNCLAHLDRDLVTGLELIHRAPERYRSQIEDEFKSDGVEFDLDAEALLADTALPPGEFGKKVFSHWCEKYPDEAAKKIGALSRVAFRAVTCEGISFGFFDLLDAKDRVEEAGNGEWRVTGGDPSLAMMVNSGANGAKQIGQVVKARGKLESVDGEISESLVGGMPWRTFFAASQNARSSMCQKKIGTQKAGHLTRQLVLGLWDWSIAEDDCGFDGDARSLLTCKCEKRHGICARCFGKLPNGEKPWIGMPIGLIAAQTLGERGTQLSMRVFQTGSNEIDFPLVSSLMTGVKDVNEITGKDEKDAGSRARSFVETLKSGAYSKIDARYFQLLWKVLQLSPKKKLSTAVSGDFFACLARGGGQMELIRQRAKLNAEKEKEEKTISLDSPFAKVFFNLFGNRAGNGGAE